MMDGAPRQHHPRHLKQYVLLFRLTESFILLSPDTSFFLKPTLQSCLISSQICSREFLASRQYPSKAPHHLLLQHQQLQSRICANYTPNRSIITVLFPIFASYKALRTSDPAQLTPWLMYWVVLSCFSLVESWTWFILAWCDISP